MRTIDYGNNETQSVGMEELRDGRFLVLTLTESITLKTRRGAEAWLRRRGYTPDGQKLNAITAEPTS